MSKISGKTINSEEYVTAKEAAAMLGVRRQVLDGWMHKGLVKPIYCDDTRGRPNSGRIRYWPRAEIEQIMKDGNLSVQRPLPKAIETGHWERNEEGLSVYVAGTPMSTVRETVPLGIGATSVSRLQVGPGWISYTQYLETIHWRHMRRSALMRAGRRCQLCADVRRLTVHHNSYERVGREDAYDLFVLCADCHDHAHMLGKVPQPPERVKLDRKLSIV